MKVHSQIDPEGAFTRHWVPELAKTPIGYLTDPWNIPAHIRQECQLSIGFATLSNLFVKYVYPAPLFCKRYRMDRKYEKRRRKR